MSTRGSCLSHVRSLQSWAVPILAAAIMAAAIAVTASTTELAANDADVVMPTYNTAWGASEPPAYVESITFTKLPDSAGVDGLISGDTDIHYTPLTMSDSERVRNAGHDIYESVGGSTYALLVNPVDDTTNGFNLFADRNARYALNFLLDRSHIVDNLLGAGAPMLSALHTAHPDYLHVHRNVTSLGIEYSPARAEQMIAESLKSAGATKDAAGKWNHGGQPVTVVIFIRSDDYARHQVALDLAGALETMGITVERKYGDLSDANSVVYATDPADQQWHIYTAAWSRGSPSEYDDSTLAQYYSPASNSLPGFGVKGHWEYENDYLEDVAFVLYLGQYGQSLEGRAYLVNLINYLGMQEAVHVFIASAYESYGVRSDVTGVINHAYGGITSEYTPLNVRLSESDTRLDIGVRHVSQSSWNYIGGFTDTYSGSVWELMNDNAFVLNPHNSDIINARNVPVSVQIAGPGSKLDVREGAISWNTTTKSWIPAPKTNATNIVTLDLVFSNWHHGQPVDINDVLYGIVSYEERRAEASDVPIKNLVTIRIIDSDTIEVYTDGTYTGSRYSEEEVLSYDARWWVDVPWEVNFVMKHLVDSDQADWTNRAAKGNSGNWIDMLDPEDVRLVRSTLAEFRDASSPHHVPSFLRSDADSAYATARYDAAISWMDSKGHMAISHGPFYMTGDIVRSPGDSSITMVTLERFDDPTYPYARGHWSEFVDFEPLSGSITVGSIAPITGSAHRYGQETQAASELAIEDFNEYLESRGEKWRLATLWHDTGSDPAAALAALESLNGQGIKIVNGPVIDVATDPVLGYANDNDMILMSCCSSVPSNAIAGDSLFRLLPDQRVHAAHIAQLVATHRVADPTHVVPIGIDNPWAVELLEAAKPEFEKNSIVFTDIITYAPDGIPAGAADAAQRVHALMSGQGLRYSDIVILYVGFGEGPEFFKAASAYDVLGDVRWFGADQNTASPNIGDDPVSAAFAAQVRFTTVQPTVSESNPIVIEVRRMLEAQGITPSAYASYAYDAVWVLGLAILEAQSSDPADVYPEIHPAAMRYVGAIGSTELNDNGDLKSGAYQSWLFTGSDGMDLGWTKYAPDSDPDARKICR